MHASHMVSGLGLNSIILHLLRCVRWMSSRLNYCRTAVVYGVDMIRRSLPYSCTEEPNMKSESLCPRRWCQRFRDHLFYNLIYGLAPEVVGHPASDEGGRETATREPTCRSKPSSMIERHTLR